MANLILQGLVPIITAIAILLNSIGGIFGVVVIPYNPQRTEVTLSGNVISDKSDVLEYYNAAVRNTGFVLGKSSYDFDNYKFENSGSVTDQYLEIYFQSMEETTSSVFAVPGHGNLMESDVTSAKMSVKDGKRTIIIKVKDYSHTSNDTAPLNSIYNAYGYTTDSEYMFSSIGFEITSGEIEFNYSDGIISCIIDDNSGKIIYGDWDLYCQVYADDLVMSMKGTEINMGDFKFGMNCNTDI